MEDQSQTNSCCANAVCGAYEYMGKRNAMQGGTRKACFFLFFCFFFSDDFDCFCRFPKNFTLQRLKRLAKQSTSCFSKRQAARLPA